MDLQSDEEDDSAIVAHASPSSLSSSGFSLSSPSPPVPLPAPFRASQSSPSPLSPFGLTSLHFAPRILDATNNWGSRPFRFATGMPQPLPELPSFISTFFEREGTALLFFAAGGSHAVNEAVQVGASLVASTSTRHIKFGYWGW